jgi:hypothetical protein
MFVTFTRILIAFPLILLLGCSPKPTVYHQQLLVFGTIVDIKIWNVQEEKGQQIVGQISEDFDYMHRAWHAWHAGALSRTNFFLANGNPFTGAPSVLPLINRAPHSAEVFLILPLDSSSPYGDLPVTKHQQGHRQHQKPFKNYSTSTPK